MGLLGGYSRVWNQRMRGRQRHLATAKVAADVRTKVEIFGVTRDTRPPYFSPLTDNFWNGVGVPEALGAKAHVQTR